MHTTTPRPHRSIAVAAVVSAALLAACGSSGSPITSAGGSANGRAQFLQFASCMRTHGVPNFPDPSGGGIQIKQGSGVNPRSPAFQSAQKACTHLLPGGGPGTGHSAQDHAQLLRLSECMRAHGISDFPDPSAGAPPQPGNGAYSVVIGRGGYFLAVPSSVNMQSPAARQAANACGFGAGRGVKTLAP